MLRTDPESQQALAQWGALPGYCRLRPPGPFLLSKQLPPLAFPNPCAFAHLPLRAESQRLDKCRSSTGLGGRGRRQEQGALLQTLAQVLPSTLQQ